MGKNSFKTSVGGQAVMEGVMMQGPAQWCLAVRAPDGEIVSELHATQKRPWAKWPLIRGVFSFVNSLVMGYRTLMRSAEIAMTEEMEEEEQSRFDAWIERRFGDAGTKVVMALSTVLGLVLAVGLFMFLPTAIVNFISRFVDIGFGKAVLEGVLKIALFVGYLFFVSHLKEIHRVFSYHGAEHKTVACYEAGDELTVENVHRHSRFHPRCGTSFLLIVLIVAILVNSTITWDGGTLMRVGLKLLMMPLVMGIAYEIIRFAGRYDNPLTRAISAPGMWLQRLTTKEPDDSMIEVAIAAISPVLPENPDEAKW